MKVKRNMQYQIFKLQMSQYFYKKGIRILPKESLEKNSRISHIHLIL